MADLYRRMQQSKETQFESPTKDFIPPNEIKIERPLASDITKHPLREDIETVLKLQVRGLESNPQFFFLIKRSPELSML